MRVAVLSSGGKDSSAAWWWATCKGWEIKYLVTVNITGSDSMMFQVPGTEIVEHHARLAGIDWLSIDSTGEESNEIGDLESGLRSLEIDAVVCGALRSDYQKSRIERMCHRLGIISFTPLWHQSPSNHITGLVNNGFGVMISSVGCEGLDASWIGRILDKDSIKELVRLSKKHRFNVDGEGGEYETMVVSGPHFKGFINVTGSKNWDGRRGNFTIISLDS